MRPQPSAITRNLPDLIPFIAPEELAAKLGVEFTSRIGANESVFGPSPLAIAAMQRQAMIAQWYGDPQGRLLRTALAGVYEITPENFVLGPGIDGLMIHLCRAYLEPGRKVVTTLGTYPTFEYAVSGSGGELVRVPYNNYSVDIDGLISAAQDDGVTAVYLANPDNPSGSFRVGTEVARLRSALRDDQLLILDEAYADFVSPSELLPLDRTDTGVVRLRTFSKAHGLAGLRVGYVMGEATTLAPLNRVRGHFEVSSVAQAGALASLQDVDYLANVIEQVEQSRERLAKLLQNHGIEPIPSRTNFVTAQAGTRAEAEALLNRLLLAGIFIRKPNHPPLDGCIRITVCTEEDFLALENALANS